MTAEPAEPPILLLVDLQQGLVESDPELGWGPRSTPHLVENVTYLLATWRQKKWPILHVIHDDLDEPDNPIAAKFPVTFAEHPSAAAKDDERVFIKHVGSAFIGTGLPEVIKSYGQRKIVVIGMDGSQCINNTVRNGTDLGFEMAVVKDACASYGMGDGFGAEETHKAAMKMLESYGTVSTAKEVLGTLGY